MIGTATMPATCGARKGKSSTKVIESYADLDPVQGLYNTYTATYYLAKLAKNQFWFACIVENYENDTYANGWVMSAGRWGGRSSQQIGTEVLIASTVKSAATPDVRAIDALPVLPFPAVTFREPLPVNR